MNSPAEPSPSPTLVEALLVRASGPGGGTPMLTALDTGGAVLDRLTPAGLLARVRAVAAALGAVGRAGDRVIVPALPGLDFYAGFLGCLYAGMTAVPVPALRAAEGRGTSTRTERLESICRDCDPVAVLMSTDAEAARADPDLLPGVARIPVEQPAAGPEAAPPDPAALDPAATALLQYTSGSTGDPRGVVVRHGNLVANQLALRDRCEVGAETTVVSWLPFFHDMGLCTAVVLPLVSGATAVTMEPATFVQDPRVWLRAIEAQEDVFAAAPDFAYDLCVQRVPEEERARFDLSTWRVAANGSEPVRAGTLRRFAEAFRPAFFREDALTPGYGLAECTLIVTMGRPLYETPVAHYDRDALAEGKAVPLAAPSEAGVELVGCGQTVPGARLHIVDPRSGLVLAERVVGEIWVDAPGNCGGYWGRQEESAEVFGARPTGDAPQETGSTFVRTGDLGFLDHGELFVTGRIKDVLIIAGENYFPQDVEAVALAAHTAFAHQRAAAWPVAKDDRSVAVVVETSERDPAVLSAAVRAAGVAVARTLPARVSVYAVARNKVPRTTSGKIRRRACAQQVGRGGLPLLAQWPSN
jgi:nonribosomal peptide synthetase protein BlmVI